MENQNSLGAFGNFLGQLGGIAASVITATNSGKTGNQSAVDVNRAVQDAVRDSEARRGIISGQGVMLAVVGLLVVGLVVLFIRRR